MKMQESYNYSQKCGIYENTQTQIPENLAILQHENMHV